MTRIDRSESQLNAEAAERRTETPVTELIEDHRALYQADLNLNRLHEWDGEYGIGLPFAGPFEGFIDWDDRTQATGVRPSRPGPLFPWSTAFYAQWAECRRSHPEHHDRPEWRGSLCYQLVSWTVRHERSLTDACLILGVTPPRAGRTLRNALLWIEGSIDRQRQRAERRESASKPTPNFPWRDLPLDQRIEYLRRIIAQREPQVSAERHDQGGIHQETCHRCHSEAGVREQSCRQCRRMAA